MKRNLLVEINAGILGGSYKRILENIIDPAYFRQRKNYDEYYCDFGEQLIDVSLDELMTIGSIMNVRLYNGGAVISPL